MIFVDDGTTDGSLELLRTLHHEDRHVIVIQLSPNFGHHLTITAGIDHANGDIVVLIDADLQDEPEEIPTLLRQFDEGYDVVYGIRLNTQHSLVKRVMSRMFFALTTRMCTDSTSTPAFFELRGAMLSRRCRETNRFGVGLMSWTGYRQTGVSVQHAARGAGRRKYTLAKQLRLAVNTITSFTLFPLRLSTYLGIGTSIAAVVYALIVIGRRLIWGLGEVGWASLMAVMLFLGGAQLLCIGMFDEYLARVLAEVQHWPLCVVARRWSSTRMSP